MNAEKEIMRRKQIRTVAILFIFVILCGIGIVCNIDNADYGSYDELNLEEYIELPDYKGMDIDGFEKDNDTLQSQVWNQLLAETEVKQYPPKQVKECYEKNLSHYENLAVDYGYESFEDYVKNEFGTDIESFKEQLTTYAESEVKNDMLVYAIAKKENISIGSDEYESLLNQALEDADMDRETFEKQFGMTLEEYAKERKLEIRFLQNKVMQVVVDDLKEK